MMRIAKNKISPKFDGTNFREIGSWLRIEFPASEHVNLFGQMNIFLERSLFVLPIDHYLANVEGRLVVIQKKGS